MKSAAEARTAPRGDLNMAVCKVCGFVYNATFDLARLDYGAAYDNTQSHSPAFRAHMDSLVTRLIENEGISNSRIVEVGCGKGVFLRELIGRTEANNTGVGFDPTYVGPEVDADGRLRFVRSFYGPDCAEISADAVVCRHVIEHVPDPLALLKTVRDALNYSPRARVFFETPDVEWILRNQVVWDFFYEHCSLFTAESLTALFVRAGFEVLSVRREFGDQYLWLEAAVTQQSQAPSFVASDLAQLAHAFAGVERNLKSKWVERLNTLTASGNVALWGAGAKGVTFANLVDPDCTLLNSVIDLNPQKQGRFLPGTGHPIIAYDAVLDRRIIHAIQMNPNYRQENEALLRESGLTLNLVD